MDLQLRLSHIQRVRKIFSTPVASWRLASGVLKIVILLALNNFPSPELPIRGVGVIINCDVNVRMTQYFACCVYAMFLDGPSDTVCDYDDAQRTTDSVD